MSKRRDYELMEERRLQGAQLLKESVSEAEVARPLDVRRQSVHEWAKLLADQGEEGLVRVPTGRKPRLNAVQLAQLAEHLQNGPRIRGAGGERIYADRFQFGGIRQTDGTSHARHARRSI